MVSIETNSGTALNAVHLHFKIVRTFDLLKALSLSRDLTAILMKTLIRHAALQMAESTHRFSLAPLNHFFQFRPSLEDV